MTRADNTCIYQSNLKNIDGAIPIAPVNGVIKWHIDESILPATIDKYKLVMAFQKSFEILSEPFNPIRFESTGNLTEAPIVIKFREGHERDIPNGFGPNVLAYAFPTYKEEFTYASDVFFNIAFEWSDMHKDGHYSLKKVCVHETMHALGFDHSDDINDILFWQYQKDDLITFTNDTRTSIKLFYGIQEQGYDKAIVLKWLNGAKNANCIANADLLRLGALCGVHLDKQVPRAMNFNILRDKLNGR